MKMKTEFFKKYKIIFLLLSVTICYLLQFILSPCLLPQYYPQSNEATIILFSTLVLFSLHAVIVFGERILSLLIADFLYGVMVCLYNGSGLYGIGMKGVQLGGSYPNYSFNTVIITVIILVIALLIVQALFCLLRYFIHKIIHQK